MKIIYVVVDYWKKSFTCFGFKVILFKKKFSFYIFFYSRLVYRIRKPLSERHAVNGEGISKIYDSTDVLKMCYVWFKSLYYIFEDTVQANKKNTKKKCY